MTTKPIQTGTLTCAAIPIDQCQEAFAPQIKDAEAAGEPNQIDALPGPSNKDAFCQEALAPLIKDEETAVELNLIDAPPGPSNQNASHHQVFEPLIKDAEGAKMLGCSKATWWRRVADGTLPRL